MCIRDSIIPGQPNILVDFEASEEIKSKIHLVDKEFEMMVWKTLTNLDIVRTVSYTHLRAHETVLDLVCRLLLEKKKKITQKTKKKNNSQNTHRKNTTRRRQLLLYRHHNTPLYMHQILKDVQIEFYHTL